MPTFRVSFYVPNSHDEAEVHVKANHEEDVETFLEATAVAGTDYTIEKVLAFTTFDLNQPGDAPYSILKYQLNNLELFK